MWVLDNEKYTILFYNAYGQVNGGFTYYDQNNILKYTGNWYLLKDEVAPTFQTIIEDEWPFEIEEEDA